MKTKLAQFVYIVNKIDRRHIQFAYFVVMLACQFHYAKTHQMVAVDPLLR